MASKLVEFPLFDIFFPDLAKYQDLNIFLLFNFLDLEDFPDFLVYFILFPSIPYSSTSLLPLFFLEAGLLLLFLLKADLLLLFLPKTGLLSNLVVFSIILIGAAILLKS